MNPNLPRLAWCAEVIRGSNDIRVLHGLGIEITNTYFVEGAWSGRFRDSSFGEAFTFTGSGALLAESDVLFCTATDTLQALYSVRWSDRLLMSNSLAFLMVQSGETAKLGYRYYDADLMSIMFGLRDYTPSLVTLSGRRVHVWYHSNVQISRQLDLSPLPKTMRSEFRDYSDYVGFLLEEVTEVITNARDPARTTAYLPITTISSGYDSPACAVLGRLAGCREAITFVTAREEYGAESDSGLQIGKFLGLEVEEFDPMGYLERKDCPEIDFLATGYGGDDLIYSSAERRLGARLLLTGYHGDKVWARHNDSVSPNIVRGDPSGGSLAEFRLRVGFLNLPVPFIGCVNQSSIHGISNSEEMKPWRVPATNYDRPIPRRIIEAAGVPRHLFGQRKKAAARPVHTLGATDTPLDQVLSPTTLHNFSQWADRVPLFANVTDRLVCHLMRRLYWINQRALESYRLGRFLRALGSSMPKAPLIERKYSKPRTRHSLLFHWANETVKHRYVPTSGISSGGNASNLN